MIKSIRFLSMGALCAALVLAQGPGPRRQGGGPPDPQAMLSMRVNSLATRLGLTDDQKAKATSIFSDAFAAGENARTNLRNTNQLLADAVKKNDTAAIDPLSVTAGSLMGQLTAIDRKADAAFYALLTADQKTKYDQMPPGGMGGPRGPGGMGGPPFQRR